MHSYLIDSSFGEIGEHPSALLGWLHLEALGDCVSAVDVSCYSWCLLPPRWLEAARIVERRLVIVSGFDHGDCEGSSAFPGGAPKGNSSGLFMSLSYLTCG